MSTLRLERSGRVAHLKICRAEKRNALDASFWTDLPRIVRELDAEGGTRVLVLSAEGGHFSSGIDLSLFAGLAPSGNDPVDRRQRPLRFLDLVEQLQDSLNALEQARFPVLAAVQGACLGGGVDLVTACDVRYASADAYFSIYETNIGMTADLGTFPRIVKLLPEGLVRELAYTGRRVEAEEARSIGLVNRVFESHEAMLTGVLSIAEEIARKAPIAVYGCKRAITHARDHGTTDGLERIGLWNASMLHVDEIMEAMAAAAQEREGAFADLPPRAPGIPFAGK